MQDLKYYENQLNEQISKLYHSKDRHPFNVRGLLKNIEYYVEQIEDLKNEPFVQKYEKDYGIKGYRYKAKSINFMDYQIGTPLYIDKEGEIK